MATVWITYSWADNMSSDVDFIAQELEASGLTVKLDRWNIAAGRRLWEQIEDFITKPSESDAWLFIASHNSLSSEPCKEEFAYALDRALKDRGSTYPVIALFLSEVDKSLIPASIRTRLYISIVDPDWKERVAAAVEGRQHTVIRSHINPYFIKVHKLKNRFAIEVRPRAGVWAPFVAGIPIKEKDLVEPYIMIGPANIPTESGVMNDGERKDFEGEWWGLYAMNQVTPIQSCYVWCNKLPTVLVFGVLDGIPQYQVKFEETIV